jgi:ABC-type Mn2+/Zn2+ transport system ATPase subunit
VAERNNVKCELLVLDEVLQQMDEEGVLRAAKLLKTLDVETVLVVCQSNSALGKAFENVDTVLKEGDVATLQLGLV